MIILVILVPWAIITLWWYVSLVYYLKHKEETKKTKDFGIKILTLGKDIEVLRRTVWCCRDKQPLVITRNEISLPNSKVMPPEFHCQARFKGEQLEWARREYPYGYTLYLDEDSMCFLDEIPDADIVQFREVPISGNFFIAAIEAHRVGFQVEQALFEKAKPLYLWGGGFAIKRWLEDKITWDRFSITEDTGFVFSINEPYTFKYSKCPIYDQAPLTIKDLICQRWRWAGGTLQDAKYLKNRWLKAFVYFRSIHWGFWVIYATLIPIIFAFNPLLITPFLLQTMVWSGIGARQMRLRWWQTAVATLLAPLTSYFHSFGATLALFRRPRKFIRTPKI